jgi:hypothetical protein
VSASVFPVEGAYAAAAALDRAADLDHTPQPASWHRISRRMWVTTCESCGAEIWISGPQGGWRYGGSATREACTPQAFEGPGGAA